MAISSMLPLQGGRRSTQRAQSGEPSPSMSVPGGNLIFESAGKDTNAQLSTLNPPNTPHGLSLLHGQSAPFYGPLTVDCLQHLQHLLPCLRNG